MLSIINMLLLICNQIKFFHVTDKMDKKIHQAASKCLEKAIKTVSN